MLHQLVPTTAAPKVDEQKVDAPKPVEYKDYAQLKTEFAQLTHPQFKTRLLPEIPAPTFDSFMCHLDNASYVTLWMHENKRIAVKPLPARSRDIKFAKENKEKENKKKGIETKSAAEPIYREIPKPKNEASNGKAPKEGSVMSMRYIAKRLFSATGEIQNGDELCTLINSLREHDKEQKYTAKNIKATNKDEYIKAITDAIDSNSPPIVAYDFVSNIEIDKREGEREHSTLVVGYIQTTGTVPQTQFAILGEKGYCIVTADQLYASTSQLESRLYNKEKSNLELENRGRIAPMDKIRKADAEIKREFENCNAIKVMNMGIPEWWPVTKTANFFVREFISLPELGRRTVAKREDENGWRNTVVVIQPDELTSPKLR